MGDDFSDDLGNVLSSTDLLLRLAGRGSREMMVDARRQLAQATERSQRAAAEMSKHDNVSLAPEPQNADGPSYSPVSKIDGGEP